MFTAAARGLAGVVTIPVNVATRPVHEVLENKYRTFFLAEDLLDAERRGRFTRRSIADGPAKVLEAIAALNDRDNPFKERCLYCVGESVELPADFPYGEGPVFADVRLRVYFRRALFGLSANPAIKVVLDAIRPVAVPAAAGQRQQQQQQQQQRQQQCPKAWVPCRRVPPSTGRFLRSPRPDGENNGVSGGAGARRRFDHSLPGLLWANESTGYDVVVSAEGDDDDDAPAYEGAKVTLRDYQKETVRWMRRQEEVGAATGGGVPGLNGYFWERRSFAGSDDEYYYFPLGGHVLLNPPPVVSGGLLAEEMGLGKSA